MFCPDLTFRRRKSVLSEDQIEQIRQATLEVLGRTGFQQFVVAPRDPLKFGFHLASGAP
jgi:hypothetical protein